MLYDMAQFDSTRFRLKYQRNRKIHVLQKYIYFIPVFFATFHNEEWKQKKESIFQWWYLRRRPVCKSK